MSGMAHKKTPDFEFRKTEFAFGRRNLAGTGSGRVNVLILGGDQDDLRSLHDTLRERAKVTLAEDLPQALKKLAAPQFEREVLFPLEHALASAEARKWRAVC